MSAVAASVTPSTSDDLSGAPPASPYRNLALNLSPIPTLCSSPTNGAFAPHSAAPPPAPPTPYAYHYGVNGGGVGAASFHHQSFDGGQMNYFPQYANTATR